MDAHVSKLYQLWNKTGQKQDYVAYAAAAYRSGLEVICYFCKGQSENYFNCGRCSIFSCRECSLLCPEIDCHVPACQDCAPHCYECDKGMCPAHYDTCEICSRDFCWIEPHTENCAWCGRIICLDHLERRQIYDNRRCLECIDHPPY